MQYIIPIDLYVHCYSSAKYPAMHISICNYIYQITLLCCSLYIWYSNCSYIRLHISLCDIKSSPSVSLYESYKMYTCMHDTKAAEQYFLCDSSFS